MHHEPRPAPSKKNPAQAEPETDEANAYALGGGEFWRRAMTLIIATLACLYCFGLGWLIGLNMNLNAQHWYPPRGTELQEWRWQ